MRTNRAEFGVQVIEAGENLPCQRHLVSESIFYVLEGKLECLVDDVARSIDAGQTLVVQPGDYYSLRNVSTSAALVVEVQIPPCDDGDRLPRDAVVRGSCQRPLGRFWRSSDRVRTKVCGVSSADAAHLCDVLGVDAIGLHLVGRDRVEKARLAERWLSALPPELSVFILTDADDPYELVELACRSWCDTVQLQGNKSVESVARCAEVLRAGGWKMVKSVGLSELGADALSYAREVAAHSDAVLLDTNFVGGTGSIPDWSLARRIVKELAGVPVLLAGGLTPENVAAAIATVGPFGVDVESGVEVQLFPASGGRRITARSPDKVRKFIEAARGSVAQ